MKPAANDPGVPASPNLLAAYFPALTSAHICVPRAPRCTLADRGLSLFDLLKKCRQINMVRQCAELAAACNTGTRGRGELGPTTAPQPLPGGERSVDRPSFPKPGCPRSPLATAPPSPGRGQRFPKSCSPQTQGFFHCNSQNFSPHADSRLLPRLPVCSYSHLTVIAQLFLWWLKQIRHPVHPPRKRLDFKSPLARGDPV